MEKTPQVQVSLAAGPQCAVLFNGNIAGLQIPERTPKCRNANMTQTALQAPGLYLPMGFCKQATWALCPK